MLRKHHNGFSLLEVLLAVSIVIILGSLQLRQYRRDAENAQAKAVGEQLRMVGNALNSYISLNYNNIVNLSSVPAPGTAADPGPRTCDTATMRCTITSDTLQRLGLVPNSFSGRNAFGATYEYHIRVQGAAPNWRVDGLVVTSEPYRLGGQVNFALIGQALMQAGADSGTTRTSADRVDGLNGAWAEQGYPTDEVGLLAYRAGYGTSNYSSYLRLDGSTPMAGDLRLSGHDILEARRMIATDDVQGGRLLVQETRSDAIVLGAGPYSPGTPAPVNPDRTIIGNNGNGLVVRNEGGVQFLNAASTGTSLTAGNANLRAVTATTGAFSGALQAAGMTSNGNIQATGQINSASDIIAGGNFSTINGNFITTNGDISATAGTVQAANLNITGTASVGRTLNMRDGGTSTAWFYTGSGNLMRLLNNTNLQVDGNVDITAGSTGGGNLNVAGRVTTSGGLKLNNVQAVGASCTAAGGAGSFAPDASGNLLQCISGVWTRAGSIDQVTTIFGAQVSGGGTSTAACPAGYKAVGGGYHQATQQLGSAPQSSYGDPTNNRWVVVASGAANLTQATVMCAR